MCHRDGQKRGGHVLPIVHWLIVEIRPVEIKVRVELSFWAGVCKVDGFFRVHGNKDLNQRKQPGKNALYRIFFNLVTGLFDGISALFQFHVDDRHSVDEQHQIATAVVQNFGLCGEFGLLCDLIPAVTGCNLQPVVNLQRHFLAEI